MQSRMTRECVDLKATSHMALLHSPENNVTKLTSCISDIFFIFHTHLTYCSFLFKKCSIQFPSDFKVAGARALHIEGIWPL